VTDPALSRFVTEIDRRLGELIEESQEILPQAMRYSLLSGGKRLRPLLVLAATDTFGGPASCALDPACAIEMVHAYSLIHDDLPCMDDDDMRRGRPTCHRAFSEGIAVLAGDALLTEAFRVISRSNHLSCSQIVRLIDLLANRTGKEGMVGGQAIDILSFGQPVSFDLLNQMDLKKTGDLFSCCLEFGAIIANADASMNAHLRQTGLHLGLAYQIRDDLEDTEPPAKGIAPTFSSLLGQQTTRKLLHQTVGQIHQHLSCLPSGAPLIKKLIDPLFKPLVS
jgi:geranylgeranyl diphosphate synthase, type II